MGTAGVVGVMERAAALVRRSRAQLTAARRRRDARRLAQETAPGRRATIARSWLEAELSARIAVRSGVRGDDYLRARLARYAAALPMPLEARGVGVSFENGEPVIRARGGAPSPASPPAHSARELEEARGETIALSDRVAAARAHLDGLLRAVSEDLASGTLPGDPALLDASPEQRGRPPVPSPAPPLFLGGLALALLASAGFRMAEPAFALAGLSPETLAADLARDGLSTVSALLFGLGAAVAAFAFLSVAIERGGELLAGTAQPRRQTIVAVAAGAAFALSAAVALSATHPALLTAPVLLLTAPLGAVFLARQAGRLAAVRAQALVAALEWDRGQAGRAAERARRGESITRAEAALAGAAQALEAAEARLQALEQRSADEAREAALLAARAAVLGERLAESLAAALELDRYAFLRRAAVVARAGADVRPLRTRRPTPDPTVRGPLEAAG